MPAKWRHHNRRETSKTTHHSLHPTYSFTQFTSPFQLGGGQGRSPSEPVPPHLIQSWNALSVYIRFPFFCFPFHPKKKSPLRISVCLLLHFFCLLISAGIEPHSGHVQNPCSECGSRVHAGWVAFLFMVQTMVPPPLRRNPFHGKLPVADPVELPNMFHPSPTCSTHQRDGYGADTFDLFFQRSLSTGPHSPAHTSTSTPGPALEGGRFLQFNCNGIQHCHAELQDFLHRDQVLVACVQETKLGVNSSLKEFTDYATIRRDRPGGCGGGLATLVHHSVPFRVPDGDILPKDDTAEVLAVEVDLGGRR